MFAIQIFIYLQVLDFITTMIGFKVGAKEASPFIVELIHYSTPALGVAASKLVALTVGGLCLLTHRARLVSWINYWYAGLVVWNLSMIMKAIGVMTASGASALPHVR